VSEGEIITLIGANGAGKSTTLHAISNIIKKTSGTVVFDKRDISSAAPDSIVASGLVQVPEGRRIFANLSVRDNLEMGAYCPIIDNKIFNLQQGLKHWLPPYQGKPLSPPDYA
jgi:branched-chain amino acid transport system ATP-binding protein